MNTKQLSIGALILIVLVAGWVFLGDNGFTGGSTSDNWSVGGNLSVTGTTALTGATSITGATTFTGAIGAGTVVVDRFTEGATTVATSTAGTATILLSSDVSTYSGMDMTPGDNAVTLTTQATTTMSFIPNAGDCMNFRFRNLDSVAATSTTIAAGTGVDLVENENGDVVIEGGNEAQLKFCRELDTDVTLYVDEYIAAD